MSAINFRQLINLAIGSPEPGHVNFYALHCVLLSFAEKLNLIEEKVDENKFDIKSVTNRNLKSPKSLSLHKKMKRIIKSGTRKRMTGGADVNTEGSEHAITETDQTGDDEAPDETQELTEDAGESADMPEESQSAAPTKAETPNAPLKTATSAAPITGIASAVPVRTPEMQPPGSAMKLQGPTTETNIQSGGPITATISKIETRLLYIENELPRIPAEIQKGVTIMREQLETAMDQLQTVTTMMIKKKETDQVLNESEMKDAQALQAMRTLQKQDVDFTKEQYDMDLHLSYTPEKMLDHLLELKTEFCALTNKINDVSATVLEQDCQRTIMAIQDLQEQMRDVKYFSATLRDSLERIETKQQRDNDAFTHINKFMKTIMEDKIDKSEIEILLADKVDYKQLQRKVAVEELDDVKCCMEKKFCLIQKIFDENERNFQDSIEDIRTTLGPDSINQILNKFKAQIEKDIKKIQTALNNYIELTNDDCAAAGARVKVLQDLACLSCDTTCVMRTVEKSKVPKLPNAHLNNGPMLGPLIAYELGSIRKSGVMGYYRKDDFPHSPDAWMKGTKASIKMCVPRHAGGHHTTHTAQDVVEKVLVKKQ